MKKYRVTKRGNFVVNPDGRGYIYCHQGDIITVSGIDDPVRHFTRLGLVPVIEEDTPKKTRARKKQQQ